MAQNFAKIPSIYPKLLEIRKSKTAELKSNKYLKETLVLRYYQVIGALHMMLLTRMVLADAAGLGKCVSGDTYVPTSRGLIKIKDLCPENCIEDTFYPLADPYKILSQEGEKVPQSVYYSGFKSGLNIKTSKGFELTGLPHHPIYVPDNTGFNYRRLDSLKIGDFICLNRKGLFPDSNKLVKIRPIVKTGNNYKIPENLGEDLAELLGYYVSEGHGGQKQSFIISQQYPETHTRIRNLLKDQFNYEQSGSTLSAQILRVFEDLGVNTAHKSEDQIVPPSILKSPKRVVSAFLRGYFEGDGGIEKAPLGISCCSKSKELITQIQLLLLQFGIVATKNLKIVKAQKERELYWRIHFFGADVDIFKECIGFVSDRKINELEGICGKIQNKEIYSRNFYFDKIVEITPKEDKFYDFCVPETHNFTGNGFINHNTVETIAAYAFLLEKDPTLKLIVICPKSAVYQWQEEFEKFSVGITTRVLENKLGKLEGFSARKEQYKAFKENVIIMNYNPVIEEYEYIKKILMPNYMMVIDEVHTIKNRKAKINFGCKEVAQSASRVYGLSATVIKNSLEEVYGVFSVIVPNHFGNITGFLKQYTHTKLMKLRIGGKTRYIPQIDTTKGLCGYKNLDQFKQLIDPYILARKKEDVASELPKLISRKVILKMESEQKELYKLALNGILYEEKVKRDFYEVADSVRTGSEDAKTLKKYEELKSKYELFLTEEGKKRGKLAALTYCQMISNGPSLVGEKGPSSKEKEFERLLTEEITEGKIIVFSRFKQGIPNLEVICDKKSIGHTKITGDVTSSWDRDVAKRKFMGDSNCRVIFITLAGSASLNLQAAGVIVFYDTPWSYGDLVQIIGRAQRIGSIQENVLLLHFANKGTIDMRVLNKVSDKKELSNEVLGDTSKGALDFTGSEDVVINDLFQEIVEDAKELNDDL